MKLHRYDNFIKEALSEDIVNKLSDKLKDLKKDLLDMVSKSVNSDDESVMMEKIDSIIRDFNESTIEGLIQDSDIQDFYRKYRNDIDQVLNDNNFFEKISDFQKKENCVSLYDFVIVGTKEFVKIMMTDIKNDLSGETPEKVE